MTVIQDGEARHYQGDAEVENEEAEEQRFSTLEKKIRALEKSKKSVLELQKKMKRGIEMDPQQQAPRSYSNSNSNPVLCPARRSRSRATARRLAASAAQHPPDSASASFLLTPCSALRGSRDWGSGGVPPTAVCFASALTRGGSLRS